MKASVSIPIALFLCVGSSVMAQRHTDPLDRGLVAVSTSSGVFASWRILPDEYYDVTYNLYRDGALVNSEPLSVSNFADASGSSSSTYTVRAVVDGVEQSACNAVSVWSDADGNGNRYKSIAVSDVYDRNGALIYCACGNHTVSESVAQNYTINDISLGDVDGDGKIDFIVKRKNQTDQDNLFPTDNTTAFCRIEVYASSISYGLLWWIDCGPNTVYGSDEQWDAVAFDWDQDGRCEVLYRAYSNSVIHKADGSTVTIGLTGENIRNRVSHTANLTFTNCGNEYLVYMDGLTGAPYVTMDYPLKRLETSEFSTAIDWSNPDETAVSNYLAAVKTAWGDNYGHRSSKYFMGAPYLDGRTPSIYLGRGIYTRHKMIALDVNPTTHALTTRWTWSCNDASSAWYGNGNHNFSIGDVDEDGRDEIIYGSMVIDDNGKGLSTTGLGHGDASHTGDLDPYRKGLETFACNEDNPSNNYRNATTCEIYHRDTGSDDDGRCLAGNFSSSIPGCLGRSVGSGLISTVTGDAISGGPSTSGTGDALYWSHLNFRIYWDGDLLEEVLDSPGTEGAPAIYSPEYGRLFTGSGCTMINYTKNQPCAAGDIMGDWREEVVVRCSDNNSFRIYTTVVPTAHRIPSLWFDHQYRQAMVWQSEGYNQPAHVSYFLGELEDITVAPPPLTNSGRTELSANGIVSSAHNNGQVMICDAGSYGIAADGASPKLLVVNVPSVVSGNNDNDNISYSYQQTQLGATISGTDYKGDLTGAMRLVKQGDGLLKLTARTFSYNGATDVWGGSLFFRGTLANSPLWMNRHTSLYTAGTFGRKVTMEYGSTLNMNYSYADGTTEYATATIDTLELHEGARVVFDVDASGGQSDALDMKRLIIRSQDWEYGPTYLAPVLQVNSTASLGIGQYPIGTLYGVSGDLSDIVIECDVADGCSVRLVRTGGMLYLSVYDSDEDYVGATDNSSTWWTAFSDSYTLSKGFTYNVQFTNWGALDKNYYNWILVAANGSGHSTADRSDYAEYFVLRADNYGWGTSYGTPSLTRADGSDLDWNYFRVDMYYGATVDMTLSFDGTAITMSAVITATNSGRVYNYSYTSATFNETDEVTVFFTVEKAHITRPTVSGAPKSDIHLTYVNYNDADTACGEADTITVGYNKLSGGNVAFTNTSWGVNYIGYVQVDASAYKSLDNIATMQFSMDVSGSTDSKRTTGWGIGYNGSAWSSAMTYNTSDHSITTIGGVQWSASTSATSFNTLTWDVTDVFMDDDDGVLTLLIYETQASGGYMTNPTLSVTYSDPAQYTVAFDANGGSGTMASQTISMDETQSLMANAFTRTNYAFAGWNTAADGSGTSFADCADVCNLTDEADATVTLYAQWSYSPASALHLTYVNYDDADTACGEVETARTGCNKLSGSSVDFYNTNWGVNYIAYLQVDASAYKNHTDVSAMTLGLGISGSTDSKRAGVCGIGYNSSTWSSAMTCNSADRSITTIGSTYTTTTKSSTVFETATWDLADVFNADDDGVLTIVIYATNGAGIYVKNPTLDVTFETLDTVLLADNVDVAATLSALDGQTVVATLSARTIDTEWNTLTVPFDVTATQLTETFGADVLLYELSGSTLENEVLGLEFTSATTIEAGKPYLIKATADVQNPTFCGVTVDATANGTSTSSYVDFVPTLNIHEIDGDGTDDVWSVLVLGTGNALYNPTTLTNAWMRAFRGYFRVHGEAAGAAQFRMAFDEAEDISGIRVVRTPASSSAIYDLTGRHVTPETKGLYITSDRKIIIKH